MPYSEKIRRALHLMNWSPKNIGDFRFGELKKLTTKYCIWVWINCGPFLVLHGERWLKCAHARGLRCEVLVLPRPLYAYSLAVAMDTFEVESYVRGQSLRSYVICACFICLELLLAELNLAIFIENSSICQIYNLTKVSHYVVRCIRLDSYLDIPFCCCFVRIRIIATCMGGVAISISHVYILKQDMYVLCRKVLMFF